MMMNEMMGRRVLLSALSIGAGALAVAGRAPAGAAQRPLDPANPLDQSFIFKRLAYASGSTPRFSWLRGTRYALVNTDLIPLWEMHVGTIFQVHESPDAPPGAYRVTAMSTSFYTDLHSGAFLKSFKNPFTGKTVPMGYFPPKPATLVYTVDGLVDPPGRLPPGLTTIGRLGPTWIEGDVVCTVGDNLVLSSPGSPRIRVNDLSTYVGSLKAVMDPAVAMPQAHLTFSDINTWPPWLQMGDQPGTYYSRAIGQKELTYQGMPALWRTLMASEYPAVARDPIAALAG